MSGWGLDRLQPWSSTEQGFHNLSDVRVSCAKRLCVSKPRICFLAPPYAYTKDRTNPCYSLESPKRGKQLDKPNADPDPTQWPSAGRQTRYKKSKKIDQQNRSVRLLWEPQAFVSVALHSSDCSRTLLAISRQEHTAEKHVRFCSSCTKPNTPLPLFSPCIKPRGEQQKESKARRQQKNIWGMPRRRPRHTECGKPTRRRALLHAT